MKKKILIALAAMGMGMGISTTASADFCNYNCNLANYYCNVAYDNVKCRDYAETCERCQGHSGI